MKHLRVRAVGKHAIRPYAARAHGSALPADATEAGQAEPSFTCAECGLVFLLADGDDELARTEAARDWPGVALEDLARVCEACYRRVMHREREAVK